MREIDLAVGRELGLHLGGGDPLIDLIAQRLGPIIGYAEIDRPPVALRAAVDRVNHRFLNTVRTRADAVGSPLAQRVAVGPWRESVIVVEARGPAHHGVI